MQILPVLGNYSIDHLNENKQLVLSLLTPLSNSYANFKSIRGYVNSVLDWAEELEYIQVNKVKKTISRIKANKKLALKESKKFEDLALNEEELKQWLQAFDENLKNDQMELKDYAFSIRHSFYQIENQKPMLSNGNISILKKMKFSLNKH